MPTAHSPGWAAQAFSSTSPLAQNPDSGGTAAMASQPMAKVMKVMGMYRRRFPIRLRSCSSWRPWMAEPAPRNSRPLKKAWATIKKMAAS